jgi:hypothetical protein
MSRRKDLPAGWRQPPETTAEPVPMRRPYLDPDTGSWLPSPTPNETGPTPSRTRRPVPRPPAAALPRPPAAALPRPPAAALPRPPAAALPRPPAAAVPHNVAPPPRPPVSAPQAVPRILPPRPPVSAPQAVPRILPPQNQPPQPPAPRPPAMRRWRPMRGVIGDDNRTPMLWCEFGSCIHRYIHPTATSDQDLCNRAIAAGWRYDGLGRLACPSCARSDPAFVATRPAVPPDGSWR